MRRDLCAVPFIILWWHGRFPNRSGPRFTTAMPIIYALVARRSDVLAEYTLDGVDGNFATFTRTLRPRTDFPQPVRRIHSQNSVVSLECLRLSRFSELGLYFCGSAADELQIGSTILSPHVVLQGSSRVSLPGGVLIFVGFVTVILAFDIQVWPGLGVIIRWVSSSVGCHPA